MFESFIAYSLDVENHGKLKKPSQNKSLDFVNIWEDVIIYYLYF